MRKFILIIFLVCSSCNQDAMLETTREYLESEVEGEIYEIEKYKGDGYLLTIKYLKERDEIGVYKSVGENCRKGDYFIKFKNSNKCILKRNDSLICLDCINIEDELRDSLGRIKEWKNYEKNIWKVD